MFGRSAFPRWMPGTTNMFCLPCGIALFRAKGRLVANKRFKRSVAFATTLRNILRAYLPTLLGAGMQVQMRSRLISVATYFAESFNTFATRRSSLSPSGISTCFGTEPSVATIQ
jgi:hypothetical protein